MVATLQFFFSQSPQNAEESDPRHIGNLFYIFLCSHFDEKNGDTTLPGGRVSRRQSQRVGMVANLSHFFLTF